MKNRQQDKQDILLYLGVIVVIIIGGGIFTGTFKLGTTYDKTKYTNDLSACISQSQTPKESCKGLAYSIFQNVPLGGTLTADRCNAAMSVADRNKDRIIGDFDYLNAIDLLSKGQISDFVFLDINNIYFGSSTTELCTIYTTTTTTISTTPGVYQISVGETVGNLLNFNALSTVTQARQGRVTLNPDRVSGVRIDSLPSWVNPSGFKVSIGFQPKLGGPIGTVVYPMGRYIYADSSVLGQVTVFTKSSLEQAGVDTSNVVTMSVAIDDGPQIDTPITFSSTTTTIPLSPTTTTFRATTTTTIQGQTTTTTTTLPNCGSLSGWYSVGGQYTCCSGEYRAICTNKEYRQYSNSVGCFSYTVTQTKTDKQTTSIKDTECGYVSATTTTTIQGQTTTTTIPQKPDFIKDIQNLISWIISLFPKFK